MIRYIGWLEELQSKMEHRWSFEDADTIMVWIIWLHVILTIWGLSFLASEVT